MSSEVGGFPVRVGLARKDGDIIQNGANEIFMINPDKIANRRVLADILKSQFHSIEKSSDSVNRINVPDRCFWGQDYDAERIKITWDPLNTYNSMSWAPGTSVNETEITDHNLQSSLKALVKSPPSSCALSVLIAHNVPKDLTTARSVGYGQDF